MVKGALPYGSGRLLLFAESERMKKRAELKRLREAKGLTLEQVAEALSLSTSQIQRFEAGTREPRIGEAVKLSSIFGVDVGEMFPELRSNIINDEQINLNSLLDAVLGAFEMITKDQDRAAYLLKIVLSVAQEQPTPSAGPDFHRVLAEHEARKFLQEKRLPHDGA